jgi:hypothetical protein
MKLEAIENQITHYAHYLSRCSVSAISSSFVIQKAKQDIIDIKRAIIYLAICHIPAVTTLVIAFIMM